MKYKRKGHSDSSLLKLYRRLLMPRMIEEKMLLLLRKGQISKWFSGIGQEAISVGVTAALLQDETIFTMHRNLGVFTTRDVPLNRLFAQWQGKQSGFTKGRDRSFHFGAPEYNIVGMISHLGPQLSLADGVGLAHKLSGEKRVAVAFTGEGGTSQGEFHEALNVASVWKLPVIFVIENNGYGLSTPSSEQYSCDSLADRGIGYGMKSIQIDGNNILEVYETIKNLAADLRENPEPALIECRTFRMRGHEEASGTKYVPKELFEEWGKKDPISNFQSWLLKEELLDESMIEKIKESIKEEIETNLEIAFAEEATQSDVELQLRDVYAPYEAVITEPQKDSTTKRRLIDSIHNALNLAMYKHDNLVLMGQDIAEYGGVFKATDGFVQEFGKERVRNTPLCESAIIGATLGMSLKGYKSMVEMQFADFVTCGFNQIINNLAKVHYRWGQNADVVVRMPTGAGVGAGPYHSQSNEAWFTHTPGLKVVYPSNPYDAKGLLLAAFEDPNPVMFFEHKALYRSVSAEIPDDYYTLPLGQAAYARRGKAATIITYGYGVHWAQSFAESSGIDLEIIDLRTLSPIDYDTISESVKKTNRAIVLHEDTMFGGIGGELAAWIGEHCFEDLDAPVRRVASMDTPVPFAAALEKDFLPQERFATVVDELLAY